VEVSKIVPVIRFVDGKRLVGSGYRVAGRLVLTAAHCVRGAGHRVLLADGERGARVVVDGRRMAVPESDWSAGVDLALLEIVPDTAGSEAPLEELPPPACARIDRTTARRVRCMAIGYPEHMATTREPFRTAQLDGWIATTSGLADTAGGRHAGYMTLKAEGVPSAPLPTSERKLGRSAWAGMSGAAVFAADWLVGVVAEHHLPEGDGSLTVVPIEWVDRLPEVDRAAALRALGLGSVNDLELLVEGTPASPSSGGVFISYRRQDTAPYARLLREELSRRVGPSQVFMDVDSIEVGVDFAEAIQRAVDSCQVLLALVGPRWLTITDAEGQRRLDDPGDTVRLEIEAALARNVRVIPVLVDNTLMPRHQQLPESLMPLARRNALELTYNRYEYDLGRLLKAVEKIVR
jgi:hypothetical protein